MKRAFIFPGQGSQTVGMGRALADNFLQAREVFEEIDDVLSQKLSKLMWEGPLDELTLTANAQPALMAASLAAFRVLQAEAGFDLAKHASFVAGHSLGEYSALAAAGSLPLAQTARLLRIRGNAMQSAVPVGQGAMAALLGLEYEEAVKVASDAAQKEVCDAANDNGGGQVVISGHKAAVERAITLAQERGAKRAIILPVSAPFHSALMAPAAEAMQAALTNVSIKTPTVPVVINVEARPVSDPEIIRDALVRQVTGTVRWRESMVKMADEGVESFYEVGAGKVLTGLVKRIVVSATGMAIGTPDDITAFLSAFKQ